MGNPQLVRQLRKWSNSYALDIIFFSKTMIKKNEVEALKERLGFANASGVASRVRSGGAMHLLERYCQVLSCLFLATSHLW